MIKNQLKTALLLSALTGLMLGIGQLVSGTNGLIVAFIFAIIMNFCAYWFSDKVVLAIYRAKEIKGNEEERLQNIVKEVAEKGNILLPKMYIIPSDNANAFATGRNKNHAAIACTRGILNLLDDEELKGVISHEIAHIKNKDILISSIAGTIAGVISYIAFMARWAAIFGGIGNRDDDNSGNLLGFLLLAIVTPIIATLIQLAISRSREFLADATGASIIKNPNGLASALEKLEADSRKHPMVFGNVSTAHLFISNPFRGQALWKFFSTHPPMDERIKKLREMRM